MGMALAVAQVAGQMYSTYKQGQLQEEYYEQLADAERQKAAITAKKAEIESENDAYAQKQRNAQMAVVRGSINAKAGATGSSGGGSFTDLLNAAQNAYEEDTVRALYSQRQKQTNFAMERNNYLNQAEAYRVTANNVMSAAKAKMWSTLASGAANMYANGMFNTGNNNITTTAWDANVPKNEKGLINYWDYMALGRK